MKSISHIVIAMILFFSHNKKDTLESLGGGTSIITFVMTDYIWIASDTKGGDFSEGKSTVFQESKIFKHKDIYYAFAGMLCNIKTKNGKVAYSAEEVMKNAINNTERFDESMDLFKGDMLNTLNSMINRMDMENKSMYNALPHRLVQCVAVSFENGVSRYKSYEFQLNSDKRLMFIEENKKYDTQIRILGYDEKIISYLKKEDTKPIFEPSKMKETLSNLIELEIKAHPEYVGPPIDVLMISKDGHKWLTNNEVNFK